MLTVRGGPWLKRKMIEEANLLGKPLRAIDKDLLDSGQGRSLRERSRLHLQKDWPAGATLLAG